MNPIANEMARVAQELTSLNRNHVNTESPQGQRAIDLLAGIEASLADLVEAAAVDKGEADQLKALVRAVSNLKFDPPAPKVQVTTAPVTVNVPEGKAPVVHVAAPVVNVEPAKSWTSIEVVPRRDTRTGEVLSYTIRRIA